MNHFLYVEVALNNVYAIVMYAGKYSQVLDNHR